MAQKIAQENNDDLRVMVVVPTNQLVDQSKEDFELFAPSTLDNIGLYDSNRKTLTKAFTITTYNSWFDLAAEGKIGSHNIDILISDEAHRGTSERRVEAIEGTFDDERTVQLAFTATAHFDEEKSVEASHEREIFYKSLPQSIREGELCPYVQSQRYVIRAEIPDELKEAFEIASETGDGQFKRRIKQKAWNKRVHTIFREGRDERTGDLLSDNQAGFFVDGIKQADELEVMLNADPVLQARAKEQGREGVAVAIHSKLSPTEQDNRYKAYKRGEYMAIIGDEKFKEGFNHPPMKSLFDYPHGSLVDKVQILGRGARKWWNELKQRNEGMTIIDTVVYLGDDDKEVNDSNREEALYRAVSVKSILDGSHALSEVPDDEEFVKVKGPNTGGGIGGSLFPDDADIEEYTTLESLYELEEEVSKIAKEIDDARRDFSDYISITAKMRKHLHREAKRTGFGSKKIMNDLVDDVQISVSIIEGWKSGLISSASKSDWHKLINAYAKLPNGEEPLIPITDEMYKALTDQVERTGVLQGKILKTKGSPEGLTAYKVKHWRSRFVKSALKSHWDWLIAQYALLPDAKQAKKEQEKNAVTITPKMRADLIYLIKTSGMSIQRLFKEQTPPEGLTKSRVQYWTERAVSAPKNQWNWVQAQYKKAPVVRVVLDDNTVKKLEDEIERTGVSVFSIFKERSLPEHLRNGKKITSLKNQRTALVRDWNDIMRAYASLPDKGAKPSATDDNSPAP